MHFLKSGFYPVDMKGRVFIRVRRLHQGKLNATSFVDFDEYDGNYRKENKAVL